MSEQVEQAKRELQQGQGPVAPALQSMVHRPQFITPRVVQPIALTATTPGVNPQDFFRDNRIMVKDGALFIDPYLAIHPRELDPKNEAALRRKLQLTYSINNPSFYESPARVATALNLGQLLPVSLVAKRSKLMDEVKKFNAEVDSGKDLDLLKEEHDKRSPFSAIVRDTVKNPEVDPVGLDLLKNGLAMYLLCREKLTQNGYLKPLGDYINRHATPDQVLSDLADKIGATPLQMREAALNGGIPAVGKLLGLDPNYVADVQGFADYAATQDFSYNLVEHWHLGRQLLGITAPLAQKLQTGMETRITTKIKNYREKIHHHYDVPAPVVKEEQRIAQALELVEPIQRVMLHRLGYEICYSPEMTADDIAFYKGIYGLHRKAANDLRDVRGTYRIYFSGRGDLKGSMRTLVHETAHNLWPDQFTAQEAAQIDALAQSDQQRFRDLQQLMDTKFEPFKNLVNAYKAGNDQEKAAIAATAGDLFKNASGVPLIDGIMLGYIQDPHDFRYMVKYALDTLSVEGVRYNRSGYDGPEERFREVISRFAELKQVEYRAQPQLLHYLAPGLDQIFERHYIPHLERVYAQIGPENHPNDAMTAPLPASPVAPFEPAPKIEEHPKVEQRPGAPAVGAAPKVKEHADRACHGECGGTCAAHAPEASAEHTDQSPVAHEAAASSTHACHGDCGGACAVHSGSPETSVETNGMEHTARTMAAVSALKSMGVDPSLR